MTPVMRQDEAMKESTEPPRNRPEPAEPGPKARDRKNPKVPPASETWVEGQPTSDADYGSKQPRCSLPGSRGGLGGHNSLDASIKNLYS
jgi:hypothetical protein